MKYLSDFLKQYGLPATIILLACILGFIDVGLIGGIAVTSKILFLGIGIVYLIFHVPTLWKSIYSFLSNLWKKLTLSE